MITMKMKKREKGFTLIELIGVIVIISVICIIVTPTIINQLNNKKEKVSSAQKQILFTAADQYLEQNKDIYQLTSGDIYCVSVSQLIADGLLKTPVIDATTGNEIDKNTNIKITVSHNENKTYDIDTTNACASVNSNDIQYTLTPTNNTWSKQKVLAITYPNVTGYVNSYSLDNGVTWTSVGSSTVSLTIKKETTVLAKSEGDITINKTILVSRVDSVSPVCTLKITSGTAGSNGWYRSNVDLGFNSKSDEESGLASYGMGTSSTATYNSTTSITQSAETTGTSYYGYVKDNAGNENTCSLSVKKDALAPTCVISGNGSSSSSWATSRTVSISCSDDTSTCASSTTTKSYTTSAVSQTGTNVVIKDNAGHSSTCQYTVYNIDNVAPTIATNGAYRSTSSECGTVVDDADNSSCLFYDFSNSNSPISGVPSHVTHFPQLSAATELSSSSGGDTGHGPWHYRSYTSWRIIRATNQTVCGAGRSGSGVLGGYSCQAANCWQPGDSGSLGDAHACS